MDLPSIKIYSIQYILHNYIVDGNNSKIYNIFTEQPSIKIYSIQYILHIYIVDGNNSKIYYIFTEHPSIKYIIYFK